MAVTDQQARAIFAKALAAHPCGMRLYTFKDLTELKERSRFRTNAPAFYSAGVIYVVLKEATETDLILLITHEIGHQLIDPGNIVAGYVAFRLWLKVTTATTEQGKMQVTQNVYSDIVVNTVNWRDPLYEAAFGKQAMRESFEKLYQVKNFLPLTPDSFRKNFIRAFMALEYLRQTNRVAHNDMVDKFNFMFSGHMKTFYDLIMKLVAERDLAVRDVQAYYEIAVKIFEVMNRLRMEGVHWGGAV